MTFPTSSISTANLDSGSDNPASARADLYNAVVALNTIISEGGGANGVAVLDSNNKLPTAKLPATMQVTGDMVLQPSTAIVNIRDILRMTVWTVADIALIASPAEGDIVYCTNGDTGGNCLAVYDGTAWKRIALGATIAAS